MCSFRGTAFKIFTWIRTKIANQEIRKILIMGLSGNLFFFLSQGNFQKVSNKIDEYISQLVDETSVRISLLTIKA